MSSSSIAKPRKAVSALQLLKNRSRMIDPPIAINNESSDGITVLRLGSTATNVAFVSSVRLPEPDFGTDLNSKPDWVQTIERDEARTTAMCSTAQSPLQDLANRSLVDAHDYTSSAVGARLDAGFRLLNPVG